MASKGEKQPRFYNYNKVNDVDIESRYNLTINFNNKKKKKVRLLMENPSYADKNLSDLTTNRAIDEFSKEYGLLEIFNLSPKITTDSSQLDLLGSLENRYNKEYIISKMTDANYDMVIATGGFREENKIKLSVRKQMNSTYQALLGKLYQNSNITLRAYGLTSEKHFGIHFSKAKMTNKSIVKVDLDKSSKNIYKYFLY